MKFVIYWAVLAILLLISGSILVMYYTQNFTEDLEFKKSISLSEINYSTYNSYDSYTKTSKTILTSGYAFIGDINLKNDGYFNKIYSSPTFVPCLVFANNVPEVTDLDGQYKMNLYVRFDQNNMGSCSTYTIREDIQVGKERKIPICVYMDSYSFLDFDKFKQANLKSIKIYQLPQKELNPFGGMFGDSPYLPVRCNNLDSSAKLLATIQIN